MTERICIYHGNDCADGFGAAWAVHHNRPDWYDFYAGKHNEPPPDCTDKEVLLVDFSYKRDVMEQIARQASKVMVLDHHESAIRELQPLVDDGVIGAVFDIERSGAGITWDYLEPNLLRPKLIDHIEDRDLWRFHLPFTREIQAAVSSYPYELVVWDWLMLEAGLDKLMEEGATILRKQHKDMDEFTQVANARTVIAGYDVPVVNAPYMWASEIGNNLCPGEAFAATYFDTADHRVFSLRSSQDGVNVSEVAELFGGGGHRNAAGFRIAHDELDRLKEGSHADGKSSESEGSQTGLGF